MIKEWIYRKISTWESEDYPTKTLRIPIGNDHYDEALMVGLELTQLGYATSLYAAHNNFFYFTIYQPGSGLDEILTIPDTQE